jgi:hypothetical protein
LRHFWHLHLLRTFLPNKPQNILLLPSSTQRPLPTITPSSTSTTIKRYFTPTQHHPSIYLLNLYATPPHALSTKHHKSLGTRPQLHQLSVPP